MEKYRMLFARQRGLGICPPKPSVKQFHLADGNAMVPVGDALAEWSYMRARAGKTTVAFKVLKSSSWPVVLGLKILKRTRTLDLNWHHLQMIATQAEDFSCVHVLGKAFEYRHVSKRILQALATQILELCLRYFVPC